MLFVSRLITVRRKRHEAGKREESPSDWFGHQIAVYLYLSIFKHVHIHLAFSSLLRRTEKSGDFPQNSSNICTQIPNIRHCLPHISPRHLPPYCLHHCPMAAVLRKFWKVSLVVEYFSLVVQYLEVSKSQAKQQCDGGHPPKILKSLGKNQANVQLGECALVSAVRHALECSIN